MLKVLKRFIIFIPKLLYMQILMSLLWQIMFSFSLFFYYTKIFSTPCKVVNLSLENKILWFFFLLTKVYDFKKLLLSHFSKYSAPSTFSDLTQMKIFLQLTWWFISSHRMSLISHGRAFFPLLCLKTLRSSIQRAVSSIVVAL